jgi:hypothetical protein
MVQNFLTCDRDQPMLLPPDLRDWLDDDHLAFHQYVAYAEPWDPLPDDGLPLFDERIPSDIQEGSRPNSRSGRLKT